MKLYYSAGACSLAPHIVASEAGLPLELDKVNLRTKTTESGCDFLSVNPKGYVPALALDNGELLTEATVVIQFLADQAPASGLLPRSGTRERFRVQEWLSFVASELHKGFAPLWRPVSEDCRRLALDILHRRFAYLERALEGRSYLMGETFTAADAYAFTILNWTHFHKVDLSSYPWTVAYMRRVANRPRVRKAMAAEGLLKEA
ncbi:glutathione transferase GstA [Microvirga thermotolerans]|uniref:Glutathione transferase GstA n=1 Tax=Microvirga thermotolerans TaxID=2651334 RepID=A0A5P9JW15_9HYPH|nr:glutathione transferase GstA [Microvirga thermotolerans]QFU17002.1 glutathione transferase GstA [Microvirga thermotolerans]